MILIDGKKISDNIRQELTKEVKKLQKNVGLAVLIVGEDPASKVYVRNKEKACEQIGIKSYRYAFPAETTEEELKETITKLNQDPAVSGILVQLPLPKHLNERKILGFIAPEKDVDGFSPYQIGKLLLGEDCLVSCTPQGILRLLNAYNIPIAGKHAVVVGRSNIVGKPVSLLMLKENATVTICHSRTKNLAEVTKQADILIVAIGKANFITADMVKEGAVVIDVGINRTPDNKLCGDVDFENVAEKCSYITPVPGGVGPMTVTCLMCNTIKAAQNAN
ncbi:MAG: bifunctional methylenetetrahydrofolate dehydrogenase/methenyltetrahydrofolate cyclohydrolase FolD [Clostridia bacterium]|nr:bifunctional methylenetetrahydrofolate dehydrogenase/methenyltetrahydrofolate cyclohydrolase FolD [Clostridia bacterium]